MIGGKTVGAPIELVHDVPEEDKALFQSLESLVIILNGVNPGDIIAKILVESTNLKNLTIINNIENPIEIPHMIPISPINNIIATLKLVKPSNDLQNLLVPILLACKQSLETLIIDRAVISTDGNLLEAMGGSIVLKNLKILQDDIR